MGHGFLRESLHRFYKLSPDAHEQYGTAPSEYGEPSVSHSVRDTLQSDRRSNAVCVTPAVSGAPGRIQRERLAAERGKRI